MVYLADIDNDTHLDIVNQGNYGCQVWRNLGNARFEPVPKDSVPWAVNAHMRLDDYDMDGRLDIVTAAPGPAWKDRPTMLRVFRNEIPNQYGWLKIKLRTMDKNTMAIGASVTIFAAGTKEIIGKRVMQTDTMGCHPRLHFGLATHKRVDVEVRFPLEKDVVRFRNMAANQYVVLHPDAETDIGALLDHCARNLAKYKHPVSIDIVDALPKTTVNKTDKNKLREYTQRDYPVSG